MGSKKANRYITSISLTPEQQAWLEKEKLSLSDLVQKMLNARINGIYDDNREEVMEVLWERFRRLATWPNPRTPDQTQSWLNSAGWADELKSVSMTPHGFLAYVKRRVELDVTSPWELRFAVGIEKAAAGRQPTDQEIADEKRAAVETMRSSKGFGGELKPDNARPASETEMELLATRVKDVKQDG